MRREDKRDNIILGIVIGAIVPLLGYVLVDGLFDLAIDADLMPPARGTGIDRRMRTLSLLAICCNLVPFNYFKNLRFDQSMRGIVFPTLIYVGYWIFKFSSSLF